LPFDSGNKVLISIFLSTVHCQPSTNYELLTISAHGPLTINQ